MKAEVDETVHQAQEKGLQEISDRLRKGQEEIFESSARHLQKETDASLERMRGGLANTGKNVVEEVKKHLEAVAQSTFDSLVLDTKATSEEYRAHLRKVLQEFQDRGDRDLLAHLEVTLEKQREAVITQLQKAADKAYEQIATEIKSRSERMVQEASDAMYKQVGLAAVSMKGWTDDARAQVETYVQKSIETLQQQINESAKASLSRYHSELQSLGEDLRTRLQNAARLFQSLEGAHALKDSADASQGKLTDAPAPPHAQAQQLVKPKS
jgi:DNA anti-recombination protein RmuC